VRQAGSSCAASHCCRNHKPRSRTDMLSPYQLISRCRPRPHPTPVRPSNRRAICATCPTRPKATFCCRPRFSVQRWWFLAHVDVGRGTMTVPTDSIGTTPRRMKVWVSFRGEESAENDRRCSLGYAGYRVPLCLNDAPGPPPSMLLRLRAPLSST
jgi:hypothetical protein